MKLLNGNILTKEVEEQGGQFIMNNAKAYKELLIVEIPDTEYPIELKGATVYVEKKRGTPIEIKGEKFIVIHERDIILIL